MVFLRYAIWVIVVVISVACDDDYVNVMPGSATVVGVWLPDKQHSNCPATWMAADTKLVLNQDGTCYAYSFGKGFFQENYSESYDQGSQDVVAGTWNLVNSDGRWNLAFDWRLRSGGLQRSATLLRFDKDIEIEFWIGYPDTAPRLLFRKLVQK